MSTRHGWTANRLCAWLRQHQLRPVCSPALEGNCFVPDPSDGGKSLDPRLDPFSVLETAMDIN